MNIIKKKPRKNDFFCDVEGVGRFIFNRKTYGGQIKIDTEMVRLLGPNFEAVDDVMRTHALLIGHYNGLMVECPPGWEDLEEIDLSEQPELDNKILELYFMLRGKLDSFRVPPRAARIEAPSEGAGAGTVPDDGVLAAPQVQPAA
ncbi:hypothetical protein LXA47_19300 [Massilia sp. P8910]|uniref:hypothetical protein n=1 Tax=Massilia antarctica TaxID=2765360 RepID=UPI001E3B3DC4|nr:hypothetical protein [Massilia antarctica]MCE3605734.1 hypothetical protein [Massilia antarctica]